MREREQNHKEADRGDAQSREQAHLARSGEAGIVQGDIHSGKVKEYDLVNRTAEAYVSEQLSEKHTDSDATHGETIFEYVEENKRLQEELKQSQEANAALNAKVTSLIEQNNSLWTENTRLNDALKELQELKEKEEKRKEQAKKSQQRWREKNPEVMKRQRRESRERHKESYNEYQKEYMKQYRSRKDPSAEDSESL